MNALIVDDERLARAELRRLLAAHPDVVVVGEAGNADEAEAQLALWDVEILFLDVTMPGASGFDLLERLEAVPQLIFTTAHDEYALRAFEVNALDYLLKPIRPDRLAAALDKVNAVRRDPPAAAAGRAVRSSSERVFLRDGERCWIVTVGDIVVFEAEGNYARVHVGPHRPLIRTSLNALEARLDPSVFFRANRQHLINLRFVEAVEGGVDDSFTARLRGGYTVRLSRRQSRKLQVTLGL